MIRLDFQPLWEFGCHPHPNLRLDHWSVSLVRDVTPGYYVNLAQAARRILANPKKINVKSFFPQEKCVKCDHVLENPRKRAKLNRNVFQVSEQIF